MRIRQTRASVVPDDVRASYHGDGPDPVACRGAQSIKDVGEFLFSDKIV
jgi:hypothetical protein